MKGPEPAVPRTNRGAAGLLKSMLVAQCVLAALVVAGDLPADILLGGAQPAAPAIDIPVQPGDQTRRFEPASIPRDLPANPNLPPDTGAPARLEFKSLDDDTDAVLLNGAIADGDAERFSKWLGALPERPGTLALNSPGGDVGEALEIGRMIRATGIPVSILPGSFCFSACPYILAGGVERKVSRKSYVGVHQHYFGENTYLPAFLLVSDIQTGQAQVMTYLGEMGVDPMLMAKALMTPPDDIYILVPDELEEFGLSTTIID